MPETVVGTIVGVWLVGVVVRYFMRNIVLTKVKRKDQDAQAAVDHWNQQTTLNQIFSFGGCMRFSGHITKEDINKVGGTVVVEDHHTQPPIRHGELAGKLAAAPAPAAAPAAAAAPAPLLHVTVPQDWQVGQTIPVVKPDGTTVQVTLPPGTQTGSIVAIPAPVAGASMPESKLRFI